jgi:two-component system cell cycle sensor histidine kinase/response regulator CckA
MASSPKPIQTGKNAADIGVSSAALAEKVPAVVWSTDLEYRLTSLSGSVLRSLDVRIDDHIGHSITTFFTAPQVFDAHCGAASGQSQTFETELNGRDLQARVDPLRDAEGRIVGTIGVALDNTDHLVAHRALRLSEHSYRSLIEGAPYAICRCSPTGDLLQVNRAMLEMLGYSETELLVRNLRWDIFAEPKTFDEFLFRLRGSAVCQGFEGRWLRQEGTCVSVSLGGRAVRDSAGGLSYLDVVAENVTQRKQLEDQLRQAQKMQAIGQLAGGIAHDFNNMLTVIRGQVEVMAEEMLASDPFRSRIEEVERASERATALTRQLLAFSRRQVLQTKVLDLNCVIANLNQMLVRLIGENIELHFFPAADLWPVNVDPGQMEQVLMNLAVNARDAMLEGGKLVIETANVRQQSVCLDRNKAVEISDHVLVTVRDTGHGMDDETRARIFEPFFTTKQAGQGTGLGLSLVFGVVKQSGGYIIAESAPGQGTMFKIYLPRTHAAREETARHTPTPVPHGNETILVAEDDESIRHLVAGFLRSHGYHVLTAADGSDAMDLLQEHGSRVDLLLSDVVMPKMGGRELAQGLRKQMPDLKVVLVSGYAGDPERTSGLEAARFVQKPFSMHHLASTVREVLDGEHQNI